MRSVWRDDPLMNTQRASTSDRIPSPPRIAPVTDPSPAVLELYERGGLRAPDGSTLNIFGTLANHPALLKRWLVFASHVLAKSSLSPRDRELLILRVGVRCRAPYEFGQHHVIAQRSDISVDEIEQVKVGPSHSAWSEFEAALLRAVDELHDDSLISDDTWAILAQRYSAEQLLDLIFTVGNYHLVSFALNSCGVELDDGVPDML
jgi:4-carboxymuconolactone decarboxylase